MKKELSTLNYYDGISKGYSNLYHDEQKIKINKIKKYLPKKGILLDLGCGDGILNQFLNKNVQIISFDLSFELLKLNKNKIKIQGSAQNLPFKNQSFDCISSFTCLQDVPNPILAIDEIKRILKKEGVVILSFLKLASKLDKILNKINKEFKIIEKIEEKKDFIFVLEML